MKNLAEILNILDIIGPVIAVCFLVSYKKSLSKDMLPVLIFCLVQLYCNAVARIIERVIEGNNYWVYKINFTASFLILLYLFAKRLIRLKPVFFYTLLFFYLIISFIIIKKDNGISYFDSNSAVVESIIIVAFCLYFFYSKLVIVPEEVSIPETGLFWCVAGIFTYYAGELFLFILYKYLIHLDNSGVTVLWGFHNILLFICCLYISYGVLSKNYRAILS